MAPQFSIALYINLLFLLSFPDRVTSLQSGEKWVFSCCASRLALPTWGLMDSHWRFVEFWVIAQPQATAVRTLAILCRFSSWNIPRGVHFSAFSNNLFSTHLPNAAESQEAQATVADSASVPTPLHHLFIMRSSAASTETSCVKFHFPQAIYLMDNARDQNGKRAFDHVFNPDSSLHAFLNWIYSQPQWAWIVWVTFYYEGDYFSRNKIFFGSNIKNS